MFYISVSNLDNLDTCRDKPGSRNVAEGQGAPGHLVNGGSSWELPHCDVHKRAALITHQRLSKLEQNETRHRASTMSSKESTALGKISPMGHGFLIFDLRKMSSSCK